MLHDVFVVWFCKTLQMMYLALCELNRTLNIVF